MAPSAPIAVALFRLATANLDEQSMLQMPVMDKSVETDASDSDCACPGYFEAECNDNAFQGCIWEAAHGSNAPWCACDPNFVATTPLFSAPASSCVPVFQMDGEEYFGGNRAESFGGDVADLPMGDSPYTIEMLVKPEANIGNGGMVFWGDCSGGKAMALSFNGGPNRFRHYWWSNDLDTDAPYSLADGQYHHVAVTYDGTTRSMFVDHALLNQDTPGTHSVTRKDNFVIGKTHCISNDFFRGYIRDVKISACV